MFQVSRIPHLVFGVGARYKLTSLCEKYGKNIVLVTGKSSFDKSEYGKDILKQLSLAGFKIERYQMANEPLAENIDSIVNDAKNKQIHCVISIGGGSVVDSGKAISAMLPVEGTIENYLEGIGQKNHPGTKIPFIAIPTTSGTGSEATKNAVISKMGQDGYKKSLRHDNFIPDYAIIDPELTLDCPPEITASTGMDAFTQLVESYLSTQANDFTDILALEGIKRIISSLEKVVQDGKDLATRTDMAYAAYLSGITLANAGLGVIHGFAQPLGSLFPIPHGVVCGTLMSSAHEITLKAIDSEKNYDIWKKYCVLGGMIAHENILESDIPNLIVMYLEELSERIKIPKLAIYGVKPENFDNIIAKTSLKNHPVMLNNVHLKEILLKCL